MHFPPFIPGHRPACQTAFPQLDRQTSPLQLAAELRVQQLQTLFGILVTVDGFAEAPLLREVFHNARELLDEAALLYRQAIARTDIGAGDDD